MNKTDIKQIILEEIEAVLEEMNMSPEMMAADSRPEEDDFAFDKMDGEMYDDMGDPMEEMAPKKRFTPEEMKALATAMLKPEGFTSKDVIAATSYTSPAQANKFLKALEMKGLITITSVLKKSLTPDRDPNAPETRGRKAAGAEFEPTNDPMADLDALGLGGSIDLSDPLAENNNTMSELEKYIKKVIKEAKNPLAKKMKEIENQGRVAALETKLAAIAEMIEETEGRLTRIDEDNEFKEMMDKNAVKEVRKQLKELEKAKGKLEKERAKMEGKVEKKKEVVDEDLPVEEDTIENAVDEVELEEDNFELNESTLRFQKLAGLITESDIKKKLSLNEGVKLASIMDGDKFKGSITLVPNKNYSSKEDLDFNKLTPSAVKGDELELVRGGDRKAQLYNIKNGVVMDLITYDEALKNL